jgi:transposase
MYRQIPPIAEPVGELKQRLQREHHGRKQPRLQMLYLLASGQADTRQDVARLLGLSRNTIGRWLATYESGGLAALLDIYIPAGKAVSLAPSILASLEHALQQPAGFASYRELQQWLAQTHGVQVKYKTLYTIVRKRFHTKLKVPRPSHTKKARGRRGLSSHLYRPPPHRTSAGQHTARQGL